MPTASRVPCRACSGSGCRPLTLAERLTLAELDGEWSATVSIAARLGIHQTAACNRLNRLRALGLVEKRGDGRQGAKAHAWRLAAAS